MELTVVRPTTGALWAHQQAAMERLLPLRARMLPVGLGGGKTPIALEVLRKRGVRRALVLCPKAVMPHWEAQAGRWVPGLRVLRLEKGTIAQRAAALGVFSDGLAVLNYDAVPVKAMLAAIKRWAPEMLIMDEAQRLSAPGGQRSRAVAGIAAPWRLGLSGTVLQHSPLNAYGVYRALDPAILGTSYTRFKLQFTAPCSWGEQDGLEMGRGGALTPYRFVNLDELHRKMMSIGYQVNTRDVLDMPPESDLVVSVDLEPEARRVYRGLDHDLTVNIREGRLTASNVLVRLLRLQQITGGSVTDDAGAVQAVSTAKERALEEYLDGLDTPEPVVVFCRFRADLAAVHRAAEQAGRTSLELSGSYNELAEWLNGEATVLAVQVASGSLGVELHRAAYAVFYSLGYSLSEYLQARGRLIRPGQTRPVLFTHLLAAGTVDAEVYRALERREAVIESVMRTRGGR